MADPPESYESRIPDGVLRVLWEKHGWKPGDPPIPPEGDTVPMVAADAPIPEPAPTEPEQTTLDPYAGDDFPF